MLLKRLSPPSRLAYRRPHSRKPSSGPITHLVRVERDDGCEPLVDALLLCAAAVPSPRSSSLGFDSGSRRDNSVASFPSYAEDTKVRIRASLVPCRLRSTMSLLLLWMQSVAKLDSELEALKKELDALRSKRS